MDEVTLFYSPVGHQVQIHPLTHARSQGWVRVEIIDADDGHKVDEFSLHNTEIKSYAQKNGWQKR